MMNKYLSAALMIFMASNQLFAQADATYQVHGIVTDAGNSQPLEYVSIALYTLDSTLVDGTITKSNGQYSLNDISEGVYFVRCSFMGYTDYNSNLFELDNQNKNQDLGIIMLESNTNELNEVVVKGNKESFNNSIDRKVYNVDQDLLSQNGAVSDLLQNIPSVLVDIDGNVSLRGSSNVLILINGKPSILMGANRASVLQQMPANIIEKIEVITNPSAKFKPDGTSGIINIVVKKNKEIGLNGSISANVGNDGRYNGNVTANYNTGKFNFYGTYGFRQDDRPRSASDIRITTDSVSGEKKYFEQYDEEFARPKSHIGSMGVDFNINDQNEAGVSVDFNLKSFTRTNAVSNITKDGEGTIISNFNRNRIDYEYENEYASNVYYQHNFSKKEQTLRFEVSDQHAFEEEDNRFTQQYFVPEASDSYDNTLIRQKNDLTLAFLEYKLAINDQSELEAGYNGEFDRSDLNFFAENFDPDLDEWVTDIEKTNQFLFDETIHAFYTTYLHKYGSFSWMGGLRGEYADIKSYLVYTDSLIPNSYFNLFPTLHLAYKLNKVSEFQLNYSHRINRPEGDDLNPFPEYRDPFNVRAGNPYLKPEDIHSVELGYQWTNEKISLIPSIYYRYKYNGFASYTEYINDSVLLTTRENLVNDQAFGVEMIVDLSINKFANINLSGNGYYNMIDGSDLGYSDKKSIFTWNSSLSANFNITKSTLLQLNSSYVSKRLTLQGERASNYYMNLGIRQDILKKKAGIIFTVSDLFNTMKDGGIINTDYFYQEVSRKRDTRIFYLGFIYHFGNNTKKSEIKFDNSL